MHFNTAQKPPGASSTAAGRRGREGRALRGLPRGKQSTAARSRASLKRPESDADREPPGGAPAGRGPLGDAHGRAGPSARPLPGRVIWSRGLGLSGLRSPPRSSRERPHPPQSPCEAERSRGGGAGTAGRDEWRGAAPPCPPLRARPRGAAPGPRLRKPPCCSANGAHAAPLPGLRGDRTPAVRASTAPRAGRSADRGEGTLIRKVRRN